jgi:hypothetical protein
MTHNSRIFTHWRSRQPPFFTRFFGLPLAIALVSAVAVAPDFALSAPTKAQQQEAATRYKKGKDLFKDGDYQAALIEFRRSNELAPNYNVYFDIAQVYTQIQDYPNAILALNAYLTEGNSSISKWRRVSAQKQIDQLLSKVATVEITSAVTAAEVTVDDASVGLTPLGRNIMMSAGKHKLSVSKAGYVASSKNIEVAGGDKMSVQLDPVELKSTTAALPEQKLTTAALPEQKPTIATSAEQPVSPSHPRADNVEFKVCGTDSTITLKNLWLTPAQATVNRPVTERWEYELLAELTPGATLQQTWKVGSAIVKDTTSGLCEMVLNYGQICPVPPGTYGFQNAIDVPEKVAIPPSVGIEVRNIIKNGDGSTMLCIDYTMGLQP